MKVVKDKDVLQKIVDSWSASSKNLWKLVNCGMSSTVKIGLGYSVKSRMPEVPGYEARKGIEVEYKGVPHPLNGDYTPREQEDIDDSLYVYGKYGPQPQCPSPTESVTCSTAYSTCQSNDSDGELGAVTDHSVNDDQIPTPSTEQVTIATPKTQPQVSQPKQTVVPSCAQHVKPPRKPLRTPQTPSPINTNSRQNWNQQMERELGEGYSWASEGIDALKSNGVFVLLFGKSTPTWTNTDRVNKANQFTPRPLQLTGTQIKSGSSRVNTGKQNINSGSVHVNTARVNRPVTNQTSQDHPLKHMEHRGIFDCGLFWGIWHWFQYRWKVDKEFSNAGNTPQLNGVAEEMNRIPYRRLLGLAADYTYLPLFVARSCHLLLALHLTGLRGSLDEKSDEGFLVGYSVNSKAFRVYNLVTKKVETEETAELMVVSSTSLTETTGKAAVSEKTATKKSHSPKQSSQTPISKSADDIMIFRKELDALALKHLGPVPAPTPTSTNHVNTGSDKINTGFEGVTTGNVEAISPSATHEEEVFSDADDDEMPEIRIYDKSSEVHIHTLWITQAHSSKANPWDPNTLCSDLKLSQEDTGAQCSRKSQKKALVRRWKVGYEAMQEELNKKDERGVVIRNKARLVAQGYRQEEGIDYDEVFAPVARLEAMRLFLAFASYMGFIVYQMDVKSAFCWQLLVKRGLCHLYSGYCGSDHPKKVYKVVKALYGLHQAPRAWYATLSTFLEKHGYRRGTIDKTLFIKKDKKDIILVQIYVDDIIFGSTKKSWSDEFEALMKGRFQMSAMGELTFFLGLQVKQSHEGIFISQDKYVAEILRKFDFDSVKSAITPMETKAHLAKDEGGPDGLDVTPKMSHLYAVKRIFKYIKGKPKLGLWYPRESPLDLVAYSDSDYAAANLDRKSTTGGCQFLGRRLISWQCKKQTKWLLQTTERLKYVVAARCLSSVLWLQNQLLDYGFNFMNTIIHIDNQSTICIIKNPVYHSKTKHIEIRHHFIRDCYHHFIRDCYEKKLISVQKIHTDLNVADLLTKPFDGPRFNYLVVSIGLVLVLLGVEKSDARSTWAWKRKCQVSLANWMQFGCK
ncbi:putative ribonuclease H-like domain-containing protein [Tanacetum coccineum]